jgi:hypothetical protein
MFYYSYFMSWDMDILDTHYESIKSSYFSIIPIKSIGKIRNQQKKK